MINSRINKQTTAEETGSGDEAGWTSISSPQKEKSFAVASTKPQDQSYFDNAYNTTTNNPLTGKQNHPNIETQPTVPHFTELIGDRISPPSFPQFTETDKDNWQEHIIQYSYPNPDPELPDIQGSAAIGPRSRIDDINWGEVERLKNVYEKEEIERRNHFKKLRREKKNEGGIEVESVCEKPDFMSFWKWMF